MANTITARNENHCGWQETGNVACLVTSARKHAAVWLPGCNGGLLNRSGKRLIEGERFNERCTLSYKLEHRVVWFKEGSGSSGSRY